MLAYKINQSTEKQYFKTNKPSQIYIPTLLKINYYNVIL